MSDCINLYLVQSKSDMMKFWDLFNTYINELSRNISIGDEFDREYFYSDEYRDAVEQLRTRAVNPLRIYLIETSGIVGFCMYVTYFDEQGKCFLMEYYMEPEYRNLGFGKRAYSEIEQYIKEEGAAFIELTPTNEANLRFWSGLGFEITGDMDEDHKYFYRKKL